MNKLTIDNQTRYDTRALRSLIQACERHLGLTWRRKVIFRYSKKSMQWGHAMYPHTKESRRSDFTSGEGTWAEFFLPGDPTLFNFPSFAWLIEHELLHNKGIQHKDMTNEQRWVRNATTPPMWAEPYAATGVPFKHPVKKVVDPEARLQKRAAGVQAKLERWERNLKRAERMVKKYRAKAKYYERVLSPEAVAERAARPKPERKGRKPKVDITAGGACFSDGTVTRYWVRVSARVWEEIECRILDIDFDESMADVEAMKEDIQKHHRSKKTYTHFAIRLEHFEVLARELRDMQGFEGSPDRAIERAIGEVKMWQRTIEEANRRGT